MDNIKIPRFDINLRPKSYRLPSNTLSNLQEIEDLENYISKLDRIFIQASKESDGLIFVYNSSNQLILKVWNIKSPDRIFLLTDLHDRTLWTIQITKNWWAFRPTKAHVRAYFIMLRNEVGKISEKVFEKSRKQLLLRDIVKINYH